MSISNSETACINSQRVSFQFFRIFLFPFFLFLSVALQAQEPITTIPPKICLTQITHHASLDTIRQGIIDQLQIEGYSDPETMHLIYDNAQGSNVIAAQIAQKFAAQHPSLLIAITTPSAQTLIRIAATQKIPLLFAGVSDPIAAKIIPSVAHDEIAITGVADFPPIEQQLQVIRQTLPSAKHLGVLYNPSEANSISQLKTLRSKAKEHGFELFEVSVTKLSDITSATHSLLKKVEAILLPIDNMLASGIDSVSNLCQQHHVALFASDDASVRRGALAALCYSQYGMGKQVGAIAVRILRGEKAQHIPVEKAQNLALHINEQTALKLGLSFPEELFECYETIKEKTS